ncbi:MAG: hypothetical protein WD066_16055 [Planctomycetaceae bacterium]
MGRIVCSWLALSAVVANVTIGCSVGLHCAVMHANDPDAVRAHLGGHHHGGHGPHHSGSGHDSDSDHHPGDHWQFVAKLPQLADAPTLTPAANDLMGVAKPSTASLRPQVLVADRSALLPAPDRPVMLQTLLL